jgi:hypothetical protein
MLPEAAPEALLPLDSEAQGRNGSRNEGTLLPPAPHSTPVAEKVLGATDADGACDAAPGTAGILYAAAAAAAGILVLQDFSKTLLAFRSPWTMFFWCRKAIAWATCRAKDAATAAGLMRTPIEPTITRPSSSAARKEPCKNRNEWQFGIETQPCLESMGYGPAKADK